MPGDEIDGLYGRWTLVSRSTTDPTVIRVGRLAERGWYEQDDRIGHFPSYQWFTCPDCGGPATRVAACGVVHFDCCKVVA